MAADNGSDFGILSNDRVIEMPGGSAAPVAPENRGRLRYNETTKAWESSADGQAWTTFAGASGGLASGVADIAALQALDDSTIADGSTVPVYSMLDLWILDKSSTLTVDGITVVAASTGNWIRMEIPSQAWALRDTWHINAMTGDDENDGLTAGTALKTHAELRRRLGKQILGAKAFGTYLIITVYLDSDISEDIVADFEFARDPGGTTPAAFIIYQGTRTVLGSYTITAVTNWNNTAGARAYGSIEVAALPDTWTNLGYIDAMLVSTSGAAAGATAWVGRDLGGANNQARLAAWYDNVTAFDEVNIANGTTFQVVSLTSLTGRVTVAGDNSSVLFQDVHFNGASCEWLNTGGIVGVNTSKFSNTNVHVENAPYFDLRSAALVKSAQSDNLTIYSGGTISGVGVLMKMKAVVERGGLLQPFGGTWFFQDPGASGGGGSAIDANVLTFNDGGMGYNDGNLVFADMTLGAANFPLLLEPFTSLRNTGTIWGTGNTGANYAIGVRANACIIYTNAADALPDIQAGGTNDTIIGGAATAYGALPVTTTAKLAAITTYA